jgi:hypothetical protein
MFAPYFFASRTRLTTERASTAKALPDSLTSGLTGYRTTGNKHQIIDLAQPAIVSLNN